LRRGRRRIGSTLFRGWSRFGRGRRGRFRSCRSRGGHFCCFWRKKGDFWGARDEGKGKGKSRRKNRHTKVRGAKIREQEDISLCSLLR
jgi:hypothetical protein